MKNKRQEPLVSIIMNCHNGEKYLSESLKSIQSQTYKNYEVIFFDNCSSDDSSKIFLQLNDTRFKYFLSKDKIKLYNARNLALDKCNGEIITFLDTDDLWEVDKLELQVAEMAKNSETGLCYSYYEIYDQSKNFSKLIKPKFSKNLKNYLLKKYDIALVSIAIKKECLQKHNLRFNTNFDIIGDFDLVINLSHYYQFSLIKKNLCTYRDHKDSETNNNYEKLVEEMQSWYNKNLNNQIFSNCSNINHIKNKIYYYQGLNFLKKNEFEKFKLNLNNLGHNMYKMKLYTKFILKKII